MSVEERLDATWENIRRAVCLCGAGRAEIHRLRFEDLTLDTRHDQYYVSYFCSCCGLIFKACETGPRALWMDSRLKGRSGVIGLDRRGMVRVIDTEDFY